MIPKHPPSHLPDGTSEHTFLVYDGKSGEIVHGHKEIVLPGVELPATDAFSRRAIELAAQLTDREASSLKALAVDYDQLEPGTLYRVEVKSGRLRKDATAAAR